MGRQVRRVPLDFNWPHEKPWKGFFNPHHAHATQCEACEGYRGASPHLRRLSDQWYGYIPFKPEDKGSTPYTPDDAIIIEAARRSLGTPENWTWPRLRKEAQRLCDLFNSKWKYHLSDADVAVLLEKGELRALTHTWTKEQGWQPKTPAHVPTAREVNEAAIAKGILDGNVQYILCTAELERKGLERYCPACKGEGELWESDTYRELAENWEPEEPPVGDGYQMWETVTEGSPISPVFATPEALARYMASTRFGDDKGTPYATWLEFIRGPGWAPSLVASATGVQTGVQALTTQYDQ